MQRIPSLAAVLAAALCAGSLSALSAAQEPRPIRPFNRQNLEGWTTKAPKERSHWVVGRATLDPADPSKLQVEQATGRGAQLVNATGGGVDIYSNEKWGDHTLEVEVMVPKGSNSGIYVAGEYEVQVLDSFGKEQVGPGDLGGIYGASAPKVNAAKAPGEWQKFVIDFKAPRFKGDRKVSNAKFLKVVLNDQVIHENVEMKGPTPTGVSGKEAPTGPVMFQGDHGAVAYRNLRITPRSFDGA
ncbi:MAG: DUF1080 domain-containing protein [Armatimonadota bacterium]